MRTRILAILTALAALPLLGAPTIWNKAPPAPTTSAQKATPTTPTTYGRYSSQKKEPPKDPTIWNKPQSTSPVIINGATGIGRSQ